MDNLHTLLLISSSFFTSIISATVGMAGGTVLLSIMLLFLQPSVVIPLHAGNQLISNFSRCWLLRNHIKWKFFTPFAVASVFGNIFAAILIKDTLDLAHGTIFIALMILYSVFKPAKLPTFTPKGKGFFAIGLFIGFLGMFIGATGLILGMAFVRDDLNKEEILATQGSMQTLNHLLKILGFLWLGFNYVPWLFPLGLMMLASIIGTNYGVSLLKNIPDHIFKLIFKTILVISAIQLLIKWAIKISG